MGNCFGKRLKGPQYEVSERRMEVDGKILIEKEETTITMDAYGTKTTQIEVTRTIAVGEKTCRVIVESNEGKSETVIHKIGLTPAETEAFQEEWSLKWNHREAEDVHPPSHKKKHRHHRKKHNKVGIEEDDRGTTTVRYTSDEIVKRISHKEGKTEMTETRVTIPDHRESKQPLKQASQQQKSEK